MNPGRSRSSGRSAVGSITWGGALAHATQIKPLARDGREHAEAAHRGLCRCSGGHHSAGARAIVVPTEGLGDKESGSVLATLHDGTGQGAPHLGVAAGMGDQAYVATRRRRIHDGRVDVERVQEGGRHLTGQEIREDRRVDKASNDGLVSFGRPVCGLDLRAVIHEPPDRADLSDVAFSAEQAEDAARLIQVPPSGLWAARFCRDTPERDVAEGSVISLAKQFKHARTLCEVVVRRRQAAGAFVYSTANAKELGPRTRRAPWIQLALARFESALRVGNPVRRDECFARGEFCLKRLGRRDPRCVHQCFGFCDRVVAGAAANRQLHAQHLE